MASKSIDNLRFSAYSLKQLITRKMSEDAKFTDQVYEGSNLAILIDLVAYMYQCLVYQINNAASESMFEDTQIYENINRLVRLIGYSPKGCSPASAYFTVDNIDSDGNPGAYSGSIIPMFSTIDTGKSDSRGKRIYFSTVEDVSINDSSYVTLDMYNGIWKLYSTVFTASGTDYETFTLTGVKSDSSTSQYVSHKHIKIFVESGDEIQDDWQYDFNEIFLGYKEDEDNIMSNTATFSKIYSNDSKVYKVSLNEDKTYEIKFSDGVVGRKLKEGDKVYVWYLDTNGEDGSIDLNDLQDLKLQHSASFFGISANLYKKLFGDKKYFYTENEVQSVYPKSKEVVSAKLEESSDDIRTNAPDSFKTGNRLITKSDYEYYVKNCISGKLVDVKCMNNWEYLATFYKWLYNRGLQDYKDGHHYIKEEILNRSFQYIDPADANNVYLFIKQNSNDADKDLTEIENEMERINSDIQSIKTMTSETVILPAVQVCFDICACNDLEVARYFLDNTHFEKDSENYIEVTLDDNSIYVNSSINSYISQIILEYFNVANCKIGQNVKYDDLLNKIYQINGVQRVRTIFNPSEETKLMFKDKNIVSVARDGISFASWTKSGFYIDEGVDIDVSNSVRHMEDFQFPVINDRTNSVDLMNNKIKVIKKSLSNVSTIKF